MKKAETHEKNVLPTAEGISSKPLLLDENNILFSYSIRSSVLYCNTLLLDCKSWHILFILSGTAFFLIGHPVLL
jgi:hypothetical protein